MGRSIGKGRAALENLWRRRKELLEILLAETPVLVGTVYDTLRKCGNPTCRCAERPTHRQTLLLFKKAGRRRCRFVRQEDAAALRGAAQRYRQWRMALRDFHTLQSRERGLLKGQILKRAIALK
ncbi:MAG: hypothetical protein HYY16_18085 [Planctomycetes bacterium]|nr:hypothetical protein [Planctomycetota bacterium]